MRQVLSVSKKRLLPSWRQWKQLPYLLNKTEKRTLKGAFGVIIVSVAFLIGSYVLSHRVIIPAIGGEYTEGLVGEPQFINPLYANTSDADEDLTRLIFSGLMKWDPEEGFIPDLAESLSINDAGTIYTLRIRENARFHDGEEVRPRDVLFTINAIQNPSYRSPLASNFTDVSVVQDDDKTISFILEEPFAPFIQYLTVGILPATQWVEILPQNAPLAALNLQPIGSGPYQFAEFEKEKNGSIRSYTLERNDDYYGEGPLIETLTFKFYADAQSAADALDNKHVEGISIVGFDQRDAVASNRNIQLIEPLMSRVIVLFFNETANDALEEDAVRLAVAQSINQQAIADDLYGGSARVTTGPLIEGMLGYTAAPETRFDPVLAQSTLTEAGYALSDEAPETVTEEVVTEADSEAEEEETTETEGRLSLTLTTPSSSELLRVAELIQSQLGDVGIDLEVITVPPELLFTEVIEPRNYELLLTPIVLGGDPDPYPFWHSSQIDGGLNLAGYANKEADTLLEQGRSATDEQTRIDAYTAFQDLIYSDIPAIFLYQSPYGYAVADKIENVNIPAIIDPADRFVNVNDWYIKTKKALQ